jgi:lipopolysaccharide export LptBFGC system permease protein LptF
MSDSATSTNRLIGQIGGFFQSAAIANFLRRYAKEFFGGVALRILFVMGMVELIFIAERFTAVFRDVLVNNANLWDMALVLALTSTRIFDLALAIAVLMAVYLAVIQIREDRELLVLFAAGLGPYQFIALVFAVAVAAQLTSITVSGVLDPLSRYAARVILFDAEFRALKNGVGTGEFYYFPNRVAFAPPRSMSQDSLRQNWKLFVYEQQGPNASRIITADHARMEGPDAKGWIMLKLGGFNSRTFYEPGPSAVAPSTIDASGSCAHCQPSSTDIPGISMQVHNVTQQMTIDDLLPFVPRASADEEKTIFEQVGARSEVSSPQYRETMRMLGERFARSLLCLLAPLVALATVCLTTSRTNFLALPLACMTLMALDVTSAWLIRAISPTGPFGAIAVPYALTAAFAGLLLAMIVRWQGELVRPQLGRP